ncbi:calcium-binding protein [Tropicimonas marinistellae]|uniref:calcium-binding protein n=1 Tax=Tropicimonas marinistellae TaxID=1739787 RepID=UPI0008340137|nr:calcium-binding protein [Tropicimonas marinistellae]
MVKFIARGAVESQQSKGVPGHPSFYFDGKADVIDITSKGFKVDFDPVGDIPGLPTLPGAPTVPSPTTTEFPLDQWFGSGLKYKTVTHQKHSMETPHKGMLTRYLEVASDYRVEVTGMKLDAADFFRVTATYGNKDNQALNRKIFSGDDVIKTGSIKDDINGFKGNDLVRGGDGKDVVRGGDGKDKVFGDGGDDRVFGDAGNDKVNGGAGNDKLTGGKGADDFVFSGKFGKDVVTDFASKNDNEDIDLSGVAAIRNFRDLKANHMSQNGDDVLIEAGTNSIRLKNVDMSDLQASDFLF